MLPIDPPQTIKVYILVKRKDMYFSLSYANSDFGLHFFKNREEAEQHRTIEYLKLEFNDKEKLHVFELDFPNPAYKTT